MQAKATPLGRAAAGRLAGARCDGCVLMPSADAGLAAAARAARDTRRCCAVKRRRCRSRWARQRSLTPGSLVPRRALHRADEGGATSVLHPGTSPSSTFGSSPRMCMDLPARLFLCARCRAQVLLCSHCDRGQRYCSRECSGPARRASLRQAAQRYQRSRSGRMAHAARSLRWRAQHPSDPRRTAGGAVPDGVPANIVTHQGSPNPVADAPLAVCPSDDAEPKLTEGLSDPGIGHCRRCAAALQPWLRQGFLRRAPSAGRHLVRSHDHSP